MNSIESEIQKMNDYNDKLTEYVMALKDRAGDKMLKEFSEMRKFSMDTIHDLDIFYIEDATEMLLPQYLGQVEDFGVISPTNKKPIFHNRYVIPIKDTDGRIINLVGYSKEANERYVYGTAKYYRRRETLWGLEKLPLAYELGYAIRTEGITDAIALRNIGYPVAFGNCGTHNSDFINKQLNRCRFGVIDIPDRDAAGKRALKGWICNRTIVLYTYIAYKDIDEMCKDSPDNVDIVKEYLDICIDWVLNGEHKGHKSELMEVTIQ